MKKTVITLLLAIAIISSIFANVFAYDDVGPKVIANDYEATTIE